MQRATEVKAMSHSTNPKPKTFNCFLRAGKHQTSLTQLYKRGWQLKTFQRWKDWVLLFTLSCTNKEVWDSGFCIDVNTYCKRKTFTIPCWNQCLFISFSPNGSCLWRCTISEIHSTMASPNRRSCLVIRLCHSWYQPGLGYVHWQHQKMWTTC